MSWAGQLWKQYDPINRIIFPGVGATATYDERGKPFVGELQVRDVIYKTVVVKLPVLVPGGFCAPPRRIECPCLAVLRADAERLEKCKGRACVVYLHGNGTDIGGAAEEAKTLARELDCHVLVPEYPGYGLAEGESSEDSVDAATHACVRFAVEILGVPHERLVLYGRSVGTGPAAAAAARMTSSSPPGPPAALVLHSPYTSIYEYAREKAGGLLSFLLVSERWPTRSNLAKVGCPTLLIHGDRDEVIPFRHSAVLRKDAAKRANARGGGFGERRSDRSGRSDRSDRSDERRSHDSSLRGDWDTSGERERERVPASARSGLVRLHVQKNASHNVFDFYGDVADPIASFLKRHERAPWGSRGERREAMGLDLRHLDARVQESGPGETEEYPFAGAVA